MACTASAGPTIAASDCFSQFNLILFYMYLYFKCSSSLYLWKIQHIMLKHSTSVLHMYDVQWCKTVLIIFVLSSTDFNYGHWKFQSETVILYVIILGNIERVNIVYPLLNNQDSECNSYVFGYNEERSIQNETLPGTINTHRCPLITGGQKKHVTCSKKWGGRYVGQGGPIVHKPVQCPCMCWLQIGTMCIQGTVWWLDDL